MLDNQFEKLAQKIERRIVVESLNALSEMYLDKVSEAIIESDKADKKLFSKVSSLRKSANPIWDDRFGICGALINGVMV
jgi:hypothetical protein